MGQEDPLEAGMATHFSILAWRIPRTDGPGWLQFMGSQRVGYNWSNLAEQWFFIQVVILLLTYSFSRSWMSTMGHPPCWVLWREQARDMILINKELTVLCESWGMCTYKFTTYIKASLVAQLVKNPPAMWDLGLIPGLGRSLEKGMATHPVFWPGEFHGLYSPWGCKDSDMTERLSLTLKYNITL